MKLVYINSAENIVKIDKEVSELNMKIKSLSEKRNILIQIREGSKESICNNCNGYGYVNHWYDQDDVKSETCETCKGSGLSFGS